MPSNCQNSLPMFCPKFISFTCWRVTEHAAMAGFNKLSGISNLCLTSMCGICKRGHQPACKVGCFFVPDGTAFRDRCHQVSLNRWNCFNWKGTLPTIQDCIYIWYNEDVNWSICNLSETYTDLHPPPPSPPPSHPRTISWHRIVLFILQA